MNYQDDHNERMDGSMDCERALELVPTFVDGEASESLASAMRKHLLDCHDCRGAVQEETGLRQWFEPLAGEAGRADIEVPAGFAARVTEQAFAAASGSNSGSNSGPKPLHAFKAGAGAGEGQERRGPRALPPVSAVSLAGSPDGLLADRKESNSLGFLMGMTAAAAALMMAFTLMLAQDDRLEVGPRPLDAAVTLEEGLREIEAENAAQAAKLGEADRKSLPPESASDTDLEGSTSTGEQGPK